MSVIVASTLLVVKLIIKQGEVNNDKKEESGRGFVKERKPPLKTSRPRKKRKCNKNQRKDYAKRVGNDEVRSDDGEWEAVKKKKGIEKNGIFRVW